jgi:5'-nucleotidase
MRRFMNRVLALSLAFALTACTSIQPAAKPAAAPADALVHVVVVGTTDVHGWFNGHAETPTGGGEGVVWGGLPTLAAYVNVLRAEHGDRVLLVDSGDMFQGTLESNLFEGAAVVRGYNRIGYQAAAVGNHEFDFGPVGPDSVARKPGDDPLGALKRNAGYARFPLLSANMVEKATGKIPGWAKPYTIVRAGGARVGIIGLSTPDTPNVTMAANVTTLDFTDPVPATIAAAKELRAQGVDAIILIAHIGGRCTKNDEPHDLASCDRQQEAMRLLEELPAGTIDAFFGGHSHAQMRHIVNGIPALQGLAYSREFSTLDLWVDTKNDRVTKYDLRPLTMICSYVYAGTDQCDPRTAPAGAKLVPRQYDTITIKPEKTVAAAIEPYLRRVASKRSERLGIRTAGRFNRSYTAESALGNLLADAMAEATGADIGFMNSGGIRSDLREGELLYTDIFEVSPFDNFPTVVRLTGAQVEEMLRIAVGGQRGVMQVSGLKYVADVDKDAEKPAAERNRIVSVTLADGSKLEPEKLYDVVMPDFIAAGGDGMTDVMKNVPPERVQTSYARPIRDMVAETLKKHPQPLAPKLEGRITILNLPKQQQ